MVKQETCFFEQLQFDNEYLHIQGPTFFSEKCAYVTQFVVCS